MYSSQFGQDHFLDTSVFKGFRNGVFMDVGAHDGISINNTLFFERERGWSGVNVEPIPSVFEKLVQNRPTSVNLNCAVYSKDGTTEFLCNEGYTEMISGIADTYDPRHLTRLHRENVQQYAKTRSVIVPTKRIETICDELDIQRIHYLSIDVEGAEFDVIKSINFDKVFIDVIEFENNTRTFQCRLLNTCARRDTLLFHTISLPFSWFIYSHNLVSKFNTNSTVAFTIHDVGVYGRVWVQFTYASRRAAHPHVYLFFRHSPLFW